MTDPTLLTILIEAGDCDDLGQFWNQWRQNHPNTPIDFSGADLSRLNLSGFNLSRANLKGARLDFARLQGTNLEDANLEGVEGRGAFFGEANLRRARLKKARLPGAVFRSADLREANLKGAHLRQGYFEGACLEGALLVRAHLEEADLEDVRAAGAVLEQAHLHRAQLPGADLSRANLFKANLTSSHFSSTTNLRGARVNGAKINKIDLESLDRDRGGLTNAHLREMDIRDDVGRLKHSFMGIWATIHICCLAWFLAPYGLFLIAKYFQHEVTVHTNVATEWRDRHLDELSRRWEKDRNRYRKEVEERLDQLPLPPSTLEPLKKDLTDPLATWEIPRPEETDIPPTQPMYRQLLAFTVSRPIEKAGWTDLGTTSSGRLFLFLLLYNLLRAALLFKTKLVEYEEEITGLASRFTFDRYPRWKWFYYSMKVLFWVQLGLLLRHSYQFMTASYVV